MLLKRVVVGFAALVAALQAGEIRVIRYSEGVPFTMGEVTSRRIVHPGLGAKKTTLNLSISKPGAEFAQHVHDYSDDTILVLKGEVDLRQGDGKRRFKAGECAFVPTGQIHGTVTAGKSEATMISFQNPPDLILYTGARDSKKPGAAAPKGAITPGAVRYINFAKQNGVFTYPAMGSKLAAGSHLMLKASKPLQTKVEANGEQILFVWKGAITVTDKAGTKYTAGERDTIFVQGDAELQVTGNAEVIQVQAK